MGSIPEGLVTKVTKQLDYYFSDYNLMKDSFLKEVLIKDNGWISYETLMKFNRLNQLVDKKKDLLANVLKSEEFRSDLIEVNVIEDKIRRKADKPLPEVTEELIQSVRERTVHVWGFPKDIAFEELLVWAQKYGIIESIEMRLKRSTHVFKGCAFIVFGNKSMADLMINESVLQFKDKDLLKESKLRYYERKREFIDQKRKERNEWRAKRPENPKQEPNVRKASALKLTNAPKKLSKESIKKFFGKYFDENESKVSYVLKVFSKRIAFVRFDGNSSAADVFSKLVSIDESSDQSVAKISIDGNELSVEMLAKEEEKTFWRRDKNIKKNQKLSELKDRQKSRDKYLKKREMNWRLKRIEKRLNKLRENPVLKESAVLQVTDRSKTTSPKTYSSVTSSPKTYSSVTSSPKTSSLFVCDSLNSLVNSWPKPQLIKKSNELKEFFEKYANVIEIIINDNNNGFYIRFGAKNDAINVLAVTKRSLKEDEPSVSKTDPMSGVIDFEGTPYFGYVLTGEEEKLFWIQSIDRIEKKRIESNDTKRQKQLIRKKYRIAEQTKSESESKSRSQSRSRSRSKSRSKSRSGSGSDSSSSSGSDSGSGSSSSSESDSGEMDTNAQ